MFTVECDGTVFYDDTSLLSNVKLIEPVLELDDNAAGSFTCTLTSDNRMYNSIKEMTSTITVKKNGKYLWSGRVLKINIDFYGRKKIECEGALAYLNDTIILPTDLKGLTIYNLLNTVLNIHNGKVAANRRIYLGAVTVNSNDKIECKAEYISCFDFINQNLIDPFEGHMFITYDNNRLTLNYYEDYPNTATQSIDFGVNLLDFTKDFDYTDICTVCIPRGKQISNSSGETNEEDYTNEYVTVSSVNNNSPYIANATALSKYGRIERVVDFSEVEDPGELLKLAKIYMSNRQFDEMTLTVKAVDLHMLDSSIKSFDWLDWVHCISLPHGMDRYFPINAVSLPLDKPENVEYTLGRTDSQGLSGIMAMQEATSQTKFNEISTRESVLVAAKRNATAILSRKTTGYVNIVDQGDHSEALIISNIKDWTKASRYWKFDMNGLGFWKDGKLGGIAITMNGQIVADYITTGTMSADRIRTGIIKDVYNNNVINLETGQVFLQGSKTTVKDADGKTYSLASSKDVSSINSKITTISTQQTTIQTSINGITTNVRSLEANYGYCYTASNVAAKLVSCANFQLKSGAIIVVKFSSGNSVANPTLNVNGTGAHTIMINGSSLAANSAYNWRAGQTVHFVYDGTNWNIADGATESKIQQLANSITLSVTNGSIGKTASINISANSNSTSSGTKNVTIDMTKVREAFKNDATSITLTAGTITFNAGTFVLKAGNCTIDSNGTITAQNANMLGTFVAGNPKGKRSVMSDGAISFYDGSNRLTGSFTASRWGVALRSSGQGGLDLTGCKDVVVYSTTDPSGGMDVSEWYGITQTIRVLDASNNKVRTLVFNKGFLINTYRDA